MYSRSNFGSRGATVAISVESVCASVCGLFQLLGSLPFCCTNPNHPLWSLRDDAPSVRVNGSDFLIALSNVSYFNRMYIFRWSHWCDQHTHTHTVQTKRSVLVLGYFKPPPPVCKVDSTVQNITCTKGNVPCLCAMFDRMITFLFRKENAAI